MIFSCFVFTLQVKLYTKQGSLKYQTDCAPINGYYMIPVYDKGDYILKVEPPPGWTFGKLCRKSARLYVIRASTIHRK